MEQDIKEIKEMLTILQEQMQQVLENTRLAAKKVLTLDDVAVLTGLSKSHLYKLTFSHQVPYYKPNGKMIFFDREEVEDWMRQNKHEIQQGAEQSTEDIAEE